MTKENLDSDKEITNKEITNNFASIFCASTNNAGNANFSASVSSRAYTGNVTPCFCGCNPCICNNSTYVWPNGSAPYKCPNCKMSPCACWQVGPNTITYPWTSTGTTINIPTDPVAAKLFEMLLQGKDVIEYKEEYMTLIEQLPWVKSSNLEVMAVYERLRRLAKLLGIPIVRKRKVEENTDGDSKKECKG